MQKVRMIKTLDPKAIPNGTIGKTVGNDDVTSPGLHWCIFNGFGAYVYPNEVELVKEDKCQQLNK